MRALPPYSGRAASRKRKWHKKSREGCRNCRLRRVKCDENRPQCQKCHSYGVLCDYASDAAVLHMPREAVTRTPAFSADGTTWVDLDRQAANWLIRFGARTALTIMDVDQEALLRLAFSNPYLMHAILAVTAIHERYLSDAHITGPTYRETYHSCQGAALFNKRLSQPVLPEDRDTLWTTATFLGIVAFSSSIPSSPEAAWPLRRAQCSDIDWLRMTEAKIAIWELTNPLQPGSLLGPMAEELEEMYTTSATTDLEGAPLALINLCHLTPLSSTANNPYHTAVRTLIPLLGWPLQKITRTKVLSFTSQMQPEFRALLYDRDPVALLLLALWYKKSRGIVWWIQRRAIIECQAIVLYLRRYHGDHVAIQELVQLYLLGSM